LDSETQKEVLLFNKQDLSGFSYLEFDFAYNSNIDKVFINDYLVGELMDYSINGNASMRWHHIVIPLKNKPYSNQMLLSLKISKYTPGFGLKFVIDNIILVPDKDLPSDLALNSKNYYCTPGFNTWIPDLDPPVGTDFGDYTKYGPYLTTCDAQAAFGWTGRQCCGDDTKLGFYGEHYNDTQAGCFNASIIFNDNTVAYSKGFLEDYGEEFEAYYFKDLLFYKGNFTSCQAGLKYDWLKKSVDGKNVLSTNLVNKDVMIECTVVGSYYCAKDAWRQWMPGWNNYSVENKSYIPQLNDLTYTPKISFKTAPPGGQLIMNGNFGG
jgi:hypothetical protein